VQDDSGQVSLSARQDQQGRLRGAEEEAGGCKGKQAEGSWDTYVFEASRNVSEGPEELAKIKDLLLLAEHRGLPEPERLQV
jgi:hypothetical protein